MKSISCLALIAMACVTATASAQTRAKTQLRNRVERYHSHFLNGNAAQMWEMSSRKLRRGNDYDKAAFIKQMPKIPKGHAKTKLISLDVARRVATAKIQIDLLPVGGDKWLTEILDETWVFERGNWFFDTYRLAADSPLPIEPPSNECCPTNRWTRAAIACFSRCFVEFTVGATARPRQLRRSATCSWNPK